jgi:hypothetical protein
VKPPDTSLPTTLCFPGYIDLKDSGLSVQSVQAKPVSRVGRGQEQIVTIRFGFVVLFAAAPRSKWGNWLITSPPTLPSANNDCSRPLCVNPEIQQTDFRTYFVIFAISRHSLAHARQVLAQAAICLSSATFSQAAAQSSQHLAQHSAA